MVSIFLGCEASRGDRYVLFNTIADLHLLEDVGLVECEDVGVGFDIFSSFSNYYSFYVCDPLFPRDADIFSVANANSLLLWKC